MYVIQVLSIKCTYVRRTSCMYIIHVRIGFLNSRQFVINFPWKIIVDEDSIERYTDRLISLQQSAQWTKYNHILRHKNMIGALDQETGRRENKRSDRIATGLATSLATGFANGLATGLATG